MADPDFDALEVKNQALEDAVVPLLDAAGILAGDRPHVDRFALLLCRFRDVPADEVSAHAAAAVMAARRLVAAGIKSPGVLRDVEEAAEVYTDADGLPVRLLLRQLLRFVWDQCKAADAAAGATDTAPTPSEPTANEGTTLRVVQSYAIAPLHYLEKGGKIRPARERREQLARWCRQLAGLLQAAGSKPYADAVPSLLKGGKPPAIDAMPAHASPVWAIVENKVSASLGSGLSHHAEQADKTSRYSLRVAAAVVSQFLGGAAGRVLFLVGKDEKRPGVSWPQFCSELESGYHPPPSPSAALLAELFASQEAQKDLSGLFATWSALEKSGALLENDANATATDADPTADPDAAPAQSIPGDGKSAWRDFVAYVTAAGGAPPKESARGSVNFSLSKAQKKEMNRQIALQVSAKLSEQGAWGCQSGVQGQDDQGSWDQDEQEDGDYGEDDAEDADANRADGDEGGKKGKGKGKNGRKGGGKSTDNLVLSPTSPKHHDDDSVDASPTQNKRKRSQDHVPEEQHRRKTRKKEAQLEAEPPSGVHEARVNEDNLNLCIDPACSCDFIKKCKVQGLTCKLVDPDFLLCQPTLEREDEAYCEKVSVSRVTVKKCSCGPSGGACSSSCDAGTAVEKEAYGFCACTKNQKKSRFNRFCRKCRKWISDSGASHHMVGDNDKNAVEAIDYSRPVRLNTADGVNKKPGFFCTLKAPLRERGLLSAVYHPDITQPLLSTRQLLRDRVVTKVSYTLTEITLKMKSGATITEQLEHDAQLPLISMPICGPASDADAHCADAFCNRVEHMFTSPDMMDGEDLLCPPVEEVDVNVNKTRISNSLKHVRNMHIHDKKNRKCGKECLGCLMGRSSTKKGKLERPENAAPKSVNDKAACDFVGPWPESHMENTQLFVITDEYDRWIECYATSSRTCCGDFLDQWVKEVGRMNVIRSDNAREFKETHAPLREHAEKWLKDGQPIKVEHGPPYTPHANGLAERSNRTVLEIVRSSLVGCDPRCWDLCATAAAHVINRVLVRKWKPPGSTAPKQDKTAYEIRKGSRAPTGYFRRWGCLCFVKDQTPEDKPAARRVPAMFVGYARNGCWKILTWRPDGRFRTGFRLSLEESRSVAFVESVLIRDVDLLRDFAANLGTQGLGSGELRIASGLGDVGLGSQTIEFEEFPELLLTDGSGHIEVNQDDTTKDQIDVLTRGAIDQAQRVSEKELIESIVGSEGATPNSVSEGARPPVASDVLQHPTGDGNKPSGDTQLGSGHLTDQEISEVIQNGDDDSGEVITKEQDGIKITVKKRGRPRKTPPPDVENAPPEVVANDAPRTSKGKGKKQPVAVPKGTPKGKANARAKAKARPKPKPKPKAAPAVKSKNASKKERARAKRAFLELIRDGESAAGSEDGPWTIDQLEEGEELLHIDICLTHRDALGSDASAKWVEVNIPSDGPVAMNASIPKKEALYGPDKDKGRAAMMLEKLQLEVKKCWRDPTPEELKDKSVQTLPTAMVFTRKRPCAEFPEGKYKCRLVVLGNLQRVDDDKSCFAPVAAYPAARAFIVEGCAKGMLPVQFDIRNAFIQSYLKERINVRLPPEWNDESTGGKNGRVVRLIRALYGLRVSPVTWYKCFRDYLVNELGWSENLREPGTFRKKLEDGTMAMLLIYVDDCLLMAKSPKCANDEVQKILAKFDGQIVLPVSEAGSLKELDYLGLQVLYDAKERTMKILATKAIERLRKKFNYQQARTVSSPAVREDLTPTPEELAELSAPGAEETTAKTLSSMRSLVGGLMYIAQTARPDIAYATGRVARFQVTPTKRVVEAGKRILRYLLNTADEGLCYSPQREQEFNTTFRKVASDGDRISRYGNVVQFSDSDFAGCCTTLRSTSGSVHYYRGVPVMWQSKRQALRAESTCEAELYAAHDALKLTKSQGWLEWLSDSPPLLFVDNRSLIDLAKQEFTTKRSKHIGLRYMSVREELERLCYVPTGLNLSDPLTKPTWSMQMLRPEMSSGFYDSCAASVSICDFMA